MSTETPRLRNFAGLEGFDELLKKCHLVVDQFGTLNVLDVGSSISLSIAEIREVGLSIRTNVSQIDVLQAVGEAHLEAKDVDLIVLAEGTFLKNREVVFRCNVSQINATLSIAGLRSVRSDALRDRRHGFKLEVCFVLNRELQPVPLRPRRLGTILARETFGIVPNKLANGLVPLPLTNQVIEDSGGEISRGTVLWVEVNGDLFDSESLDEAVTIFIDEELHSILGRMRTPEAKLLQKQFALDALIQIVFLASKELSGREITDDDESSIAGHFFFQQISQTDPKRFVDVRSVLALVKSSPTTAAAILSSKYKYREMLMKLLIDDGDIS